MIRRVPDLRTEIAIRYEARAADSDSGTKRLLSLVYSENAVYFPNPCITAKDSDRLAAHLYSYRYLSSEKSDKGIGKHATECA